jgi:hypothetical protein
VVLVPALVALKQRYPDHHVTLSCDGSAGGVAALAPIADAVVSAVGNPWQALWDVSQRHALDLLPDIDLLLDLPASPYTADVADKMLDCEYVGLPRPPLRGSRGYIGPILYNVLAALLDLPGGWTWPELWPAGQNQFWPTLTELLYDRPNPLVTIHPGAGTPAKCWPLSHWIALAGRLQRDFGASITWLMGPRESALDISEGDRPAVVLRAVPLQALPVLAEKSDLYMGHDTGPSHVVAYTRPPDAAPPECLLLWSRRSLAAWAPPHLLRDRVIALPDEEPGRLSVDVVFDRAAALLKG